MKKVVIWTVLSIYLLFLTIGLVSASHSNSYSYYSMPMHYLSEPYYRANDYDTNKLVLYSDDYLRYDRSYRYYYQPQSRSYKFYNYKKNYIIYNDDDDYYDYSPKRIYQKPYVIHHQYICDKYSAGYNCFDSFLKESGNKYKESIHYSY